MDNLRSAYFLSELYCCCLLVKFLNLAAYFITTRRRNVRVNSS